MRQMAIRVRGGSRTRVGRWIGLLVGRRVGRWVGHRAGLGSPSCVEAPGLLAAVGPLVECSNLLPDSPPATQTHHAH